MVKRPMFRPTSAAARAQAGPISLLAAFLAVVLFGAAPLLAQSGPGSGQAGEFSTTYGEPSELAVSPDTEILADAMVNGQLRTRLVHLVERAGGLAITRESAQYLRLRIPDGAGDLIPLERFNGVTASFDPLTSRLSLSVAYLENARNSVDFIRARDFSNERLTPVTAIVVDYNLNLSADRSGIAAGGFLGGRVVRENLSFESDLVARSEGRNPGVTRLDTAFVLNRPDRLQTLRVGDFVSATPRGARAVRQGGIQFSSNFDLRPELVTYPLPDFAGNLAVPSQVDLIVGDRRLLTDEFEAGSFEIRNIASGLGRRSIDVVVRDALGREQVITASTYVSRQLLRKGLDEWAIGAGPVRRRYGLESNDYNSFAGSALWRRGISSGLTLGASAEFGLGTFNGGPTVTTLLGNFAEVDLSLRASRHAPQTGPPVEGWSVSGSVQSLGHGFSASVAGRYASSGFHDVARAGGDPPQSNFITLGVDFDLAALGSFTVQAVHEDLPLQREFLVERQQRSLMRAGWRRSFGQLNLYADTSVTRTQGQTGFAALIGATLPLGPRRIASASITFSEEVEPLANASISRAAVLPGEWGYRAFVNTGLVEQIYGSVNRIGEKADVALEAEWVEGRSALRARASGALVFAEGDLFAVNKARGGMVLVENGGASGVTLTRENQPVAVSRHGRASLIPDIPAYTPIRIGIDANSLPVNARTDSEGERVALPRGAVARLDLGLREFDPRLVRLVAPLGEVIAPGVTGRLMPSGGTLIVGFDALIEIDLGALALARGRSEVIVPLASGRSCRAILPPSEDAAWNDPAETKELACAPVANADRFAASSVVEP